MQTIINCSLLPSINLFKAPRRARQVLVTHFFRQQRNACRFVMGERDRRKDKRRKKSLAGIGGLKKKQKIFIG